MPGVHTLVVILLYHYGLYLCVILLCFCGIVFMVYTIVAEKRVPVQ